MPIRKYSSDEEEEEDLKEIKKINLKRPRIKYEDCPSVNSLKDLINMGKAHKYYKNINMIMLWSILPHLEELDNMIGMKNLKETILFQIIYYLQDMHLKNRNEEYLHTVIFGSPGTGKTSVSQIIGNIYKNLGVLSKNIFKIAHRDDFVAEYLGQTAIKTKKFLKSCIGGVLFIDEAYSLGPGKKDSDSFSKEAIDTLCSFLSEHKNDFCCIIAGYENEIKQCFFSVNPGLERRFPWSHKIDEYDEKDLTQIFKKMINEMKWTIDSKIDEKFLNNFFKENKNEFKNFGGDVETFISKIKITHSKRVFGLENKFKFIISIEDFNNAYDIVKLHKMVKERKIEYSYYT